MSKSSKPLISYLLLTYNQEKYIKEAIESALTQTYSPLEIIISDDCSTDNTFEIIKKTVEEYKGLHKIILNRNEHNLGIAYNVNKIMSMAKGELWVMAAGDDISLPERTQFLFEYWYPQKNKIYALTSSNITINDEGLESKRNLYEQKEDFIENNICSSKQFWGGGAAYSPLIYKTFGNISKGCIEDLIYYRRALMLGNVLFIKQPLVKYRTVGITSKKNKPSSFNERINFIKKKFELNCIILPQILKDSFLLSNNCKENNKFYNILEKSYHLQKLKLDYFLTPRKIVKIKTIYRLLPYINKRISFYHHEDLSINIWLTLLVDLFNQPVKDIIFRIVYKFIEFSNFYKKEK